MTNILIYINRYPEIIQKVVNSSEALSEAWSAAVAKNPTPTSDLKNYLKKKLIESGLGITDIKEEELDKVYAWEKSNKTVEELAYVFGDMVSRRALIGVSLFFSFNLLATKKKR